jgi:hypothetical protein
MSVAGIPSSILSGLSNVHTGPTKFQQIRSEFQQLGQDLQSGNLNQAQQDFSALTSNFPGFSQTGAAPASRDSANPLLQAFRQLGQDLQSGNLQAAQQDFTNIEQSAAQYAQQTTQRAQRHHHHHHVENSRSIVSGSQQTNSIAQDFSQLGQTLQIGNLQGAQQAFATLQNDLQQIGGFITAESSGTSGGGAPARGSLNVTA